VFRRFHWRYTLLIFESRFNRNDIEGRAREIIRQPHAFDFANYYSGAPGSCIWIIEYDQRFVGLVAVDARDGHAAREARIKHFYVDEPFRRTGIQDDLLAHAIRHTFSAEFDTIKAESNTLIPYVGTALRSAGFVQGGKTGSMGLFKWPLYEMVLSRTQWEEKN
jgi:ribosomal protein S18 acetylase RimI-like enzyme